MNEREWEPVYALGAYVLTTFVVAVPMFRIALGASRIDLNVPDWNTFWDGTHNRVMPETGDPIGDTRRSVRQ